jgi:hypothetical protein
MGHETFIFRAWSEAGQFSLLGRGVGWGMVRGKMKISAGAGQSFVSGAPIDLVA